MIYDIALAILVIIAATLLYAAGYCQGRIAEITEREHGRGEPEDKC